MNGFRSLATAAILSIAIALGASVAAGQQPGKSAKEQFVGTWTLVSIHYVHPDGSKIEPFGPTTGVTMRSSGRVSIVAWKR